jgi:hypothetical protein
MTQKPDASKSAGNVKLNVNPAARVGSIQRHRSQTKTEYTMNRILLSIIMGPLMLIGGYAFAAENTVPQEAGFRNSPALVAKLIEDPVIAGPLLNKLALPVLQQKVAELDKTVPSEIHYGLEGESVGRNGLRTEVSNHDIIKDGKKVGEARYFWPQDGYGWAEKGGTWGPPGFQYYCYRHPLILEFDSQSLEFKLSTTLEFKIVVAINYDTGFLHFKPWVFADSGFGEQWPNAVDVCIKSRIKLGEDGKLTTESSTQVTPKRPIVLRTLHGAATRDCSSDVEQFLKAEMEKIAAKFDEAAKAELK